MQNIPSPVRERSGAPDTVAERSARLVHALEEHKAINVVTVDLTGREAFADAIVIATATSVRHAQSLADAVGEYCRAHGYEYLRTEGYAAGQWILVDLNDIIVNIFLEATRDLYSLETLWSGAVPATHARREAVTSLS